MTRVNQLRSSPTTNKSLAVVSRTIAEPSSKHFTCCRTLTQGAYITLAVEHIHKGRISPLLEFIHERRISLSLSNTYTRGVYHPCCRTHSQGAHSQDHPCCQSHTEESRTSFSFFVFILLRLALQACVLPSQCGFSTPTLLLGYFHLSTRRRLRHILGLPCGFAPAFRL